jgi:ubiquinol-cytochrome c reductase cytochrome c1 subunit
MKKLISTIVLALLPAWAFGAGGHVKLDHVKVDLNDQASLQTGAKLFVNYCLSCHSASYMRYNRMAQDIGLTEKQVEDYMGFITDAKGKFKVGALMQATLSADDARAAFNTVPPDLSLTARSRGADWIYTYLRSFYRDTTASGWNNTAFPNVSMPHVLFDLQGSQRAVYKTDEHGHKTITGFEMETAGSMNPAEYDKAVRDLTTFMVYLGEPAKLVRYRMGVLVIVFLLAFLVVAYLLKKEYWKDVH